MTLETVLPIRRGPAVRVPSALERGHAAARHLLDGTGPHEPTTVAAALTGLHAARLNSPYVAYCTRSRAAGPEGLRAALLEDRTLIQLRCVRRTLHIVPLDLAP